MLSGLELQLASQLREVEAKGLCEAHKRAASFKFIFLKAALREFNRNVNSVCSEAIEQGYDSFFDYLADNVSTVIAIPGGIDVIQYMITGEMPPHVRLSNSEVSYIANISRKGVNRDLGRIYNYDAKAE